MTFKRVLVIALAGAAALPASAAAQVDTFDPPAGDNYFQPINLSAFKNPAPFPDREVGFQADTTNYTVQADMYNPPSSGGPPEPTPCGEQNTIWSVFHADRYGVMNINASGPFDSAIAYIPFKDPIDDPTPELDRGLCIDRLAGFTEDMSFFVQPKQWYAVRVGGTGSPAGGPVQIKFDYEPPPKLDADAVLTWKSDAAGRVTAVKLVVSAPKGSKVSIKCTKGGCKAPRAFTVKKTALFRPIAAVGPVAEAPAGAHMAEATSSGSVASASSVSFARASSKAGAQVHAAKKYKLLKGKRLKGGTNLIVRVTKSGYIGKYFSYPVTKSGVAAKTTRCTKPNSSTPHKKCT